jgi:release factor glutamine methyltransferase
VTAGSNGLRAHLPLTSGDSVRHALSIMTRAFEAAGVSSAAMDARFLLQGILRRDAAELIRDPDETIGDKYRALAEAVERRLQHEPVSRILGVRQFYGRPFRLTPDVLDPRPDTECLIDLVLDILKVEKRLTAPLTIADIGTGSGAIIATLLSELPLAHGIATDISPRALAAAKENATALGVLDRLKLVETRGLQGIRNRIDVVVSNPPYIPTAQIAALDVDVRDHDPHLALDGGPDGLQIYREIANEISGLAYPCWVAVEVGAGQADDVEAIFTRSGGIARYRRADLGGHMRAVALQIHR